jgi:hypothetical protein
MTVIVYSMDSCRWCNSIGIQRVIRDYQIELSFLIALFIIIACVYLTILHNRNKNTPNQNKENQDG